MPTILKFRRYTTTETASITGAVGELTIDMDKDTVVVHDGALAGGKPLATESYVNGKDTTLRSDLATLIAGYDTSTQVTSKIATAVSDRVTTTALSTLIANYDTSSQVSTKVNTAVSNLVNNAPGTLDTLKELADALGNDRNYATTITTALGTKANASDMATELSLKANSADVTTSLALKANLASPALTGTPTAPTATTGTNTTQLATTAFTIAQANNIVQTELPAGFIGMWSGVTVPSGWYLCDGTNGTPDLRDRFIVSSGLNYNVGASGGSDTKTLTTNELPAHTHSGTTSSNGSHLHLIANADVVTAGQDLTNSNYLADNGNIGTSSSYNLGGSATTPTIGNTTNNGIHSHTFTTSSVGSGAEFDIRPKYYALAFIMKHY
jgi:microcystin-dependent protein